MSENQFVLPGDVIVTGDYRPEQNVILEGNKLMSTAIGFSEIKDDLVTVTPLTGLYTPKTDDLIIGKIVSHNALSWQVDINSYYSGILTASDIFGKDYSPSRDDLSLKLKTGDIILARIANVNSRDPLITIIGENLGKIDSGELIKISPTKIPRLTGSVIQTIEASTNATITVGQNGLIILKCDNSTGLKKSIASIKMIGMAQHDANLEEKIQKFLDENN
ncbi:RNA-binding protein [Marine Group I thaumarchaeote]|jgi:exosome complex component RRP4|uniref:RNA-binding protein n=1 Tax=Marine Group I thaumarchaeote TaxID=2511932 RepID=A0A7K4N1T4_9ARCH|nr:RNA-binding protein [Marine Group I thaumarchaeote]RTZ69664.1 MAG: RNA-binding protein [Nitrososphaerota archaeon]NWJ68565.1 RNA-binding protein [Marine Group I thaumarchaeote]NWJ77335.1 RNA-binding protein [Marine Group I thaumarchaeote]NWJ99216.1 RNA-binding protein [Marine Group I thaumarchaeote]